MSAEPSPVRLITFGDVTGTIWGGLLDAGAGAALVLGADDARLTAAPGALSVEAGRGTWTVRGDGLALTIATGTGTGEPGGAQLGTATGSVKIGDATVAVDCTASVSEEPPGDRLGSLRAVTGWFGPELSLSLHALRPARSRGHADDRLQAILFEPDGPHPVDEPRLSTTVGEDGHPARTSLELWLGEGEDLHPRRAAGEASATGASVSGDGLELIAVPLRCHASGLEGSGVYVMARFS